MSWTKRKKKKKEAGGGHREGSRKRKRMREGIIVVIWGGGAEIEEFVAAGRKRNIFRYKACNSRGSGSGSRGLTRLPPGGGGEKNDDGHIISHLGHHLSPPVVPIQAWGGSTMLLHTHTHAHRHTVYIYI